MAFALSVGVDAAASEQIVCTPTVHSIVGFVHSVHLAALPAMWDSNPAQEQRAHVGTLCPKQACFTMLLLRTDVEKGTHI
jgi:hypothetical protein